MKTAITMRKAEGVERGAWSVERETGFRTPHSALRTSLAFTLIELLVVIGVIGVLAGLTFPAVQGVKASAIRTRARGEMIRLETVIERFNQKLGYYPPDNPNPPNWVPNQLYYELLGTTNIGTAAAPVYMTLDGSAQISAASFPAIFGPNVTGFVNCNRPGKGDDVPGATAFLKDLKPNQYMAITNGISPMPCTVLGAAIDGPLVCQDNNTGAKLNPWRYNSSSPRYNLNSYDLWIDVTVGNQTNRICNWNSKYLVVGAPY
jgi:prepilin-type N-terminal cleavage/methylation domain-containing protein